MNIRNALGFLALGLFMHTAPLLAQSVGSAGVVSESSVRCIWLEFMGIVIGGIGLSYLGRVGATRATALVLAAIPESFFRGESRPETMAPEVRVGLSY